MAADTRDQILASTLDVIGRHGLGRLTLDDVASAAGVSRQTVYRYFGSHDGLVQAVIIREEADMLSRLVAATADHTELRPALEAALRVAFDAATEHPLLSRLLAEEPEALLPYLLSNTSPVLSAARPLVVDLLARFAPHLSEVELEGFADITTRLLVSHVVSPSDEMTDEVVTRIAHVVTACMKP